jgi:hypothetical protein
MEWGVFPVCSPPDSRGQTEARCPQTPSPPTFSSLKKDLHKKDEKNSLSWGFKYNYYVKSLPSHSGANSMKD